jgi:hypothetical protein
MIGTYIGNIFTNCVQTVHQPPSLRLHCSSLSTVSHPRVGTELHPGKGFLTRLRLMDHRKDSISGAHSTNNLQPLIPHMPFPPKEVCPFSPQQSLDYPIFLPGLQQQVGPEVSEHCSCNLETSGINPQQLSRLKNCSRD